MSEAQPANAPATSKDVGLESFLLEPVRTDRLLTYDLMHGTDAMRASAELWLPKEENEEREAYENRLERTFLFPGFKKTVRALVGKVFRKPITWDVPKEVADLVEDFDLQGNHADIVARDLMTDLVADGIAFALVEYPVVENYENQTLADQRNAQVRPYVCVINPRNVIGWRVETINGKKTLTQLRVREFVIEPDGDFSEFEVEQIRVIERDRWMIYRERDSEATDSTQPAPKKDEREWELYDDGANTLGEVPLVVMYGPEKIGELLARPALMDLAFLNVAHWQSSSDQRNILHFARVPILFAKGFPDESQEGGGKVTISSGHMISVTSKDADLKWVEHTGQAVTAGDNDIQRLENQMAVAGASLLVKKAPTMTATQRVMDGVDEDSDLAAMARALRDGLEQMFVFFGKWMKLSFDSKMIKIAVNTDFGITQRDAADLTVLLNAANANKISQETFLNELKRRDVLDYDLDVEKEIETTKNEVSAALELQQEMMPPDAGVGAGA